MTRQEFIEKLKTLRAEGWEPYLYGDDGDIRLFKPEPELYFWCPITAVVRSMTGEVFKTYCFIDAASKIGLDNELADQIAVSADQNEEAHVRSKVGDWDASLRAEMLEALGL